MKRVFKFAGLIVILGLFAMSVFAMWSKKKAAAREREERTFFGVELCGELPSLEEKMKELGGGYLSWCERTIEEANKIFSWDISRKFPLHNEVRELPTPVYGGRYIECFVSEADRKVYGIAFATETPRGEAEACAKKIYYMLQMKHYCTPLSLSEFDDTSRILSILKRGKKCCPLERFHLRGDSYVISVAALRKESEEALGMGDSSLRTNDFVVVYVESPEICAAQSRDRALYEKRRKETRDNAEAEAFRAL